MLNLIFCIFLLVHVAKKIINPLADSTFMKRRIAILSMFVVLVLLFGCTNVVRDTAEDAVDQNNPSLCKKLEEATDVKKCYELVAENMNDPEVCKQSTDNNGCVTNFAVQKSSLKYCDMTTDAAAKTACILSVTGDQTGRALEDILADWRSKGAVSKCKEQCEQPYRNCMEAKYQEFKAKEAECIGKGDPGEVSYCTYAAEEEFSRQKLDCYDEEKECKAGCMPKEE
jgi:hypothetical protein